METEKLLIAKIHANQKILIGNKNQNNEQLNELWRKIAKECKLQNAAVAEAKWNTLVNEYLKFLRTGDCSFPHAQSMRFMQQHLISFDPTSSDDLTPEEFRQLRLLLESDNDEANEDKISIGNIALNVLQTTKTELTDSIMDTYTKSTIPPVKDQITAYTITTEANIMNAASPLNEDCILNVTQPNPLEEDFVSKIYKEHKTSLTKLPEEEEQQQTVAAAQAPSASPILNKNNKEHAILQHYNDLTPLELIFLGYAKTLQKMPPALRMRTKRKISEIVEEAELELFE